LPWRQQIQDWLIAACQNVKTVVSAIRPGPETMEGRGRNRAALALDSILERLRRFAARFRQTIMLGPYNSFYRC